MRIYLLYPIVGTSQEKPKRNPKWGPITATIYACMHALSASLSCFLSSLTLIFFSGVLTTILFLCNKPCPGTRIPW